MGDGWPPSSPLEVEVCVTFREVLEVTSDCEAIGIDIPIGLPTSKPGSAGVSYVTPSPDSRWPRVCDLLARELLGGKGKSRLFLAPPRATLSAENPAKFQALHQSAAGVKASLPVWGILPRILEVDLCMTPPLQDRVFEFYPELVWMDLEEMQKFSVHLSSGDIQMAPAGTGAQSRLSAPMLSTAIHRSHSLIGAQPFLLNGVFPSKHTAEGIEARLRILEKSGLSIDLKWLTNWKQKLTVGSKATRTHVKPDDLLDAVAGIKAAMDFLTYRTGGEERLALPNHFALQDKLAIENQSAPEKQSASLKPMWGGKACNEPGAFTFPGNGEYPTPFYSYPCISHQRWIPRLPRTNPPRDSKGLRMEIWY